MELILAFMFAICTTENIGNTRDCFQYFEIEETLFTQEEIVEWVKFFESRKK